MNDVQVVKIPELSFEVTLSDATCAHLEHLAKLSQFSPEEYLASLISAGIDAQWDIHVALTRLLEPAR